MKHQPSRAILWFLSCALLVCVHHVIPVSQAPDKPGLIVSKKTVQDSPKVTRGPSKTPANKPPVVPKKPIAEPASEDLDTAPALTSLDGFSDFEESVQKKMASLEKLVTDAIVLFKTERIGKACRAFEKDDNKWWIGESCIFVFSSTGECYLYGNDLEVLWKNFLKQAPQETAEELTKAHTSFIPEMLERGRNGGWMPITWNNGTLFAYVKTAIKNGRRYIIGSGFYPDSARFTAQELVKRAIQFAKQRGAKTLFSRVNNSSTFAKGEEYIAGYDMSGMTMCHGRMPFYTGQNRFAITDTEGKKYVRDLIEEAQRNGSGWIEYQEDWMLKRAYFEAFTDPRTGKRYVLSCGYYPTLNKDVVEKFVQKGITSINKIGRKDTFAQFSSYSKDPEGFAYGPLRMFAYDMDYNMLADGVNPQAFVGHNLYETVDPEGKYVAREIHDLALNQGKGWISFMERGAYKTVFVRAIDVPEGKFIVGAGFFPGTKKHIAESLADKAVHYLETHSLAESLTAFTDGSNEFLRGDLYISVFNDAGICYASGPDREHIWADERETVDERGYAVIDKIIATAKQGGGWVTYKLRDGNYQAFAQLVNKKIENIVPKAGRPVIPPPKTAKKGRLTVVEEHVDKKLSEDFIIVVSFCE
jgi:hypothetical protein